jgi:hypothetical protein
LKDDSSQLPVTRLMSWIETICRRGGYAMSLLMALLAIYVTGIALFDEGMLRGGAIGLAGVIILLSDPLANRHKDSAPWLRIVLWLIDAVLLAGSIHDLVVLSDL